MSQYFKNTLSEFVYLRSYAKWLPEKGRREKWEETVQRYVDFMKENLGEKLSAHDYQLAYNSILNQDVMPSMRLMQFAGEAARRNNVCAYNCSFIAPTSLEDFGEIMMVSMSGTGVGFSVESKFVNQLPMVLDAEDNRQYVNKIVVEDSREGWAEAFVQVLSALWMDETVEVDYSKLRPAGAKLKVSGGTSSGPQPLIDLVEFSRTLLDERRGGYLKPIDVHDMVCKIGDIVVSGGVRRSALISLSDLSDEEMQQSKAGEFWKENPHRAMANNSAVYEEKPTREQFDSEWAALVASGTGERGIYNRSGALPDRRDKSQVVGTNPCGEILLRSKQFCNLTEVVARPEDTKETLMEKMYVATMLGTYQASLTHFPSLGEDWKKNCEEEALLGVSITGQWDCEEVRKPEVLSALREQSLWVNEMYAKQFGINPSKSITAVKPSGTVSVVTSSASGMHPRHNSYYVKNVRIGVHDPLCKLMESEGYPAYDDPYTANTKVLPFPVAVPEGAKTRHDVGAIEMLEYWKNVKINFTEHNPSVTISVAEDEWETVGNWVYENWQWVGGLSFLPLSEHKYELAPMEDCSQEEYNDLANKLPIVDFSKIEQFEKEDNTEQKKEVACSAGVCEIT